MRIIKRSFSLLELMIVLFLLTIMGSLIGIRSMHAIRNHRYEKGVEKIIHSYLFCHKMAACHLCDIYLTIHKDKDSYQITIGTDQTQGLFPKEQKMHEKIKGVLIEKNGSILLSQEWIFTSTGQLIPNDTIYLISPYDAKKRVSLSEDNLQKAMLVKNG